MQQINETNKILPRIKRFMEGNGAIVCLENNKIEYKDSKENELKFFNISSYQEEWRKSNKNEFDYLILSFVLDKDTLSISDDILKTLLEKVKSGGIIIIYSPQIFYHPKGIRPLDLIQIIKHIDTAACEILDFQTFGFDGAYGSQDLEKVEYAFHMFVRKANQNFAETETVEDSGQMVDL